MWFRVKFSAKKPVANRRGSSEENAPTAALNPTTFFRKLQIASSKRVFEILWKVTVLMGGSRGVSPTVR